MSRHRTPSAPEFLLENPVEASSLAATAWDGAVTTVSDTVAPVGWVEIVVSEADALVGAVEIVVSDADALVGAVDVGVLVPEPTPPALKRTTSAATTVLAGWPSTATLPVSANFVWDGSVIVVGMPTWIRVFAAYAPVVTVMDVVEHTIVNGPL